MDYQKAKISVSEGFHIRHSRSDPLLLSESKCALCEYSDIYNVSFQKTVLLPEWNQQVGICDPNHYHSVEDQLKFQSHHDNNMLTLESLRNHYSSCFSCGVSWTDNHVSLDCLECGGYALQRPCPKCEGECKSIWSRDMAASHESKHAKWEGQCHSSDKSQSDNCEFFPKALGNLKKKL
ncbi:uncharacterized protein LOC106468628 isoform X2 [Limulus polyphemus]|uniref:Uncharacterized protein LOC106468628 isoform X2 n=1 Tax=Limulus polyphemus TaxID=6850 RepID=A0ABM1TC54_LIMPO|nr:uncharacterized protein LOC106468628 isoform X2 [Limulus polyphemus]